MVDQHRPSGESQAEEFASQAAKRSSGLLREFVEFLAHSRKWWMTPIVIMLLLVGMLVVVAGTGVGPLLYTLF